MKHSLRQSELRSRTAFTLVEMLVAVAILVILTTLTVTAYTVNDADRVSNSVATFKNALEGARSRAISSGEVRGLRLITDANDPRIVKSMIYVGKAGEIEGQLRVEYNRDAQRWQIINVDTGIWQLLFEREIMQPGYRIEINGREYTLLGRVSDNVWRIVEPYAPREWFEPDPMKDHHGDLRPAWRPIPYDVNDVVANPPAGYPLGRGDAVIGQPVDYRIELASTALAGAEPILLDPQTCIDLDGSRVPEAWRIREDLNRDGTLDTSGSESDVNMNGQFDFSVGYRTMDILFQPDGNLDGSLQTTGVIALRFAYVSDAILAQPLRQRALGDDFSTVPGYPLFVVPRDPEKAHKALAIFPQTAGVVVAEIDPTMTGSESPGFNNDLAVQPFAFALRGEESN